MIIFILSFVMKFKKSFVFALQDLKHYLDAYFDNPEGDYVSFNVMSALLQAVSHLFISSPYDPE